ncbi:predicted protein [Nematostella vectensis]|uniref:Hexosyltransferase n=1 Tax=Nematostella vectensis TaxID=45351 RepID=A7SUJ3_NEMVE|nr:predicted protein [Nematostella vectensis]|eukprot:XP_001624712.1 predicted protein [Nematostella vectensis]
MKQPASQYCLVDAANAITMFFNKRTCLSVIVIVQFGVVLFGIVKLNGIGKEKWMISFLRSNGDDDTFNTRLVSEFDLPPWLMQAAFGRNISYERGKKILLPEINQKRGELCLLVLVISTPKSHGRREIIRQTWTRNKHQNTTLEGAKHFYDNTKVVFALGRSGNKNLDLFIEDEAELYSDIFRGVTLESYRNLVFKVWDAFRWSIIYQPKYIIKVDHDVYVNLPKFFSWIREDNIPHFLYAGYLHFNAYIYRNNDSAHFVSEDEFQGKKFPDYCGGPCYIVSGNLMQEMVKQSKNVPMFKVEDAYTGVVAHTLGVRPLDVGESLVHWNRWSLMENMKNWTESKIRDSLCLGDSANSLMIYQIHDIFTKIYSKTDANT